MNGFLVILMSVLYVASAASSSTASTESSSSSSTATTAGTETTTATETETADDRPAFEAKLVSETPYIADYADITQGLGLSMKAAIELDAANNFDGDGLDKVEVTKFAEVKSSGRVKRAASMTEITFLLTYEAGSDVSLEDVQSEMKAYVKESTLVEGEVTVTQVAGATAAKLSFVALCTVFVASLLNNL